MKVVKIWKDAVNGWSVQVDGDETIFVFGKLKRAAFNFAEGQAEAEGE